MSEPNWVPLGVRGGIIDYVGGWSAATPYKPGDVVVHNGVQYLAVNPSTNQAPTAAGTGGIGTSLPASPTDGQEFILVDSLTAPTYQWRFRYLASHASDANKWLFIGGAPIRHQIATAEATSSTTFVDLATVGPQVTLPRSGVYEITAHARFTSASTGQFGVLGVTGSATDLTGANLAAANQYLHLQRTIRQAAAAGVFKMLYRAAGGVAVTYDMRDLIITPVRVA